MFVILIGAPGSGKGTQGQFLAKELSIPHLSTGDMFRNIIEKQEPEGKLITEYVSQGKFVPSDLVNKVVYKFLSMNEYKNGCILDGYPRNLSQVEFLSSKIGNVGIKVIYFDVSEEVAKKRILGRFSCAECHKIYNKYYAKPKLENICDICGPVNFIYRADDDEETISKRMKEYMSETYPVIQYYQDHNMLLTIDANQNYDQISTTLLGFLKRV